MRKIYLILILMCWQQHSHKCFFVEYGEAWDMNISLCFISQATIKGISVNNRGPLLAWIISKPSMDKKSDAQ